MKPFIPLTVLALTGVFVGTPAAHADDFQCVGVVGPITVDNVVVPSGAQCALDGTQVLGNVKTEPGGDLTMGGANVRGNVQLTSGSTASAFFSTIGGDYQCDGCFSQDLFLSGVGGNFQVTGADDHALVVVSNVAGDVEIVDSGSAAGFFAIDETIIGGNVKFEKNAGSAALRENTIGGELQIFENDVVGEFRNGEFIENQVGGNMQLFKNEGPSEVIGNIVETNLQCKENVPPPVGGGNEAEQKEDQCAAL
jgi:hypothetical protein